MEGNPYAAPESDAPLTGPESEAEQIRRRHLNAESNIKSIGSLFFLGGILMIWRIFFSFRQPGDRQFDSPEAIGRVIGTLLVPPVLIVVAYGLTKLNRAASIVAGALSLFFLFAPPVGVVIALIFCYILFCQKGRYVVTTEYKSIIAKTPGIKRRSSVLALILLLIFIALLLFGLALFLFNWRL